MRAAAATIALIILATPTARADAPPASPAPTATSYRRYTLTADVVSLSLMVAGGLAEGEDGRDTALSSNLMGAGVLGGLFATPIIHGVRGHADRAVGSFFLRAGLGVAGAGLGFALADCRGDDALCELDLVGPGFLVGFVAASLIDAAAMTTERRGPATWAPQLAVSRDRVQLGVAAAF